MSSPRWPNSGRDREAPAPTLQATRLETLLGGGTGVVSPSAAARPATTAQFHRERWAALPRPSSPSDGRRASRVQCGTVWPARRRADRPWPHRAACTRTRRWSSSRPPPPCRSRRAVRLPRGTLLRCPAAAVGDERVLYPARREQPSHDPTATTAARRTPFSTPPHTPPFSPVSTLVPPPLSRPLAPPSRHHHRHPCRRCYGCCCPGPVAA